MRECILYNDSQAGLSNGLFGPKISSIAALSLGIELEKDQMTTDMK